jgi:hypothetical protein
LIFVDGFAGDHKHGRSIPINNLTLEAARWGAVFEVNGNARNISDIGLKSHRFYSSLGLAFRIRTINQN